MVKFPFPSPSDLQAFLCFPTEVEAMQAATYSSPVPRQLAMRVSNERGQPLFTDWAHHISLCNRGQKVMAAAPDLYRAAQQGDPLLEEVHQTLTQGWIVTSTVIHSSQNHAKRQVIHYSGSTVVQEEVSQEMDIPNIYSAQPLKDVLERPGGLQFIQALFGTRDEALPILATLADLLRVGAEEIMNVRTDIVRTDNPPLRVSITLSSHRLTSCISCADLLGHTYTVAHLEAPR